MKILLFNYEYPPLGGGAANATKYLLLEYAQDSTREVDLITSATDNITRTEQVASHIRVHYVAIGDKRGNLHHQKVTDLLRYTVRGYLVAVQLMKEQTYDVTHAFFGIPCGAMALVLKWRFGVPYIISLRGSDVPGYSARFRFLYVFLQPLVRLVWQHAQAVVANSKGLRMLALQTSPAQNIEVIPNGVDTEQFYPQTETRPPGDIIVTVGATRITERKGIIYLLQALAVLCPQYPTLKAEIMGEGSARASLEMFCQTHDITERVKFLGRIDAKETYRYYQRASIFILPSLNEGMSNALLEALASGLPAVVTDTGGSEELVTERENGLYITKESPESIEQALRRLLDNREEITQMGTASRKRAEEQSWFLIAEKYKEIYDRVHES